MHTKKKWTTDTEMAMSSRDECNRNGKRGQETRNRWICSFIMPGMRSSVSVVLVVLVVLQNNSSKIKAMDEQGEDPGLHWMHRQITHEKMVKMAKRKMSGARRDRSPPWP